METTLKDSLDARSVIPLDQPTRILTLARSLSLTHTKCVCVCVCCNLSLKEDEASSGSPTNLRSRLSACIFGSFEPGHCEWQSLSTAAARGDLHCCTSLRSQELTESTESTIQCISRRPWSISSWSLHRSPLAVLPCWHKMCQMQVTMLMPGCITAVSGRMIYGWWRSMNVTDCHNNIVPTKQNTNAQSNKQTN